VHGLLALTGRICVTCGRPQGASFTKLGWEATTKAAVKDLWGSHSAAGAPVPTTATGAIANVTVRPHSTVVLRLTKA
jgi:hypothetical protein